MIRLYYIPGYRQVKLVSTAQAIERENLVWVDLHDPAPEEIRLVQETFGITFPSRQDQEEIETSSRYIEEQGRIVINSTFLLYDASSGRMEENEITFILTQKQLFSLRYFESKAVKETVRKLKNDAFKVRVPEDIFINIIENRIDLDADLIENLSRSIALLSSKMNTSKTPDENIIFEINNYQEQIMTLREALFDKQRVISSLYKNSRIIPGERETLRSILKDINSLIEHSNFNFIRLEYMQNNFMGLINIEQNKIIKLFTVASVVFMPPTLIASIYGMNFKVMPELEWVIGYPFALLLIVCSSILTLYFFKRKKWL